MISKHREMITHIFNASNVLVSMLNDVRTFVETQCGELDVTPVIVNVHNLLEELLAAPQEKAREHGWTFDISMGSGIPEHIMCDPKYLTQLLEHLLNFPLGFTEKRGITVTATEGKERDATQAVMYDLSFAISYTDVAFSPETVHHIQQLLTQEGYDASSCKPDVWFTLTLSRQLSHALGGKFWLESKPEHEYIFRVLLPCEAI